MTTQDVRVGVEEGRGKGKMGYLIEGRGKMGVPYRGEGHDGYLIEGRGKMGTL